MLRLEKLLGQDWLIAPEAGLLFLQRIIAVAQAEPDPENKPVAKRPSVDAWGDEIPQMQMDQGVATIPIQGVLVKGATGSMKQWGISSYEDIDEDIDTACKSGCHTMQFMMNCPGGTHMGTHELATRIAGLKLQGFHTVSYNATVCCSAAEYITAGVARRYGTPTSINGSIGTILTVVNFQKRLEEMGIGVEVFTGGKFKASGHPAKQLTPDQREFLQSVTDDHTNEFRSFMREHRGLLDEHMEGQWFTGTQAYRIGLLNDLVNGPNEMK